MRGWMGRWILAMCASLVWCGGLMADPPRPADAEAIREALVAAFDAQEEIHRAWEVLTPRQGTSYHLELFMEGDSVGTFLLSDDGEALEVATDGEVSLAHTPPAAGTVAVPGARRSNRMQPKWHRAAALLSELWGRPIESLGAHRTVVSFVVDIRERRFHMRIDSVTNADARAEWLRARFFEGKDVRQDEESVTTSSAGLRVQIRRSDGTIHTLEQRDEDGEVALRISPAPLRRTGAEWKSRIEALCGESLEALVPYGDDLFQRAELAGLLNSILAAHPDLAGNANRLRSTVDVLLAVLYADDTYATWWKGLLRREAASGRGGDQGTATVTERFFEVLWDTVEPSLPTTTLAESDRQNIRLAFQRGIRERIAEQAASLANEVR